MPPQLLRSHLSRWLAPLVASLASSAPAVTIDPPFRFNSDAEYRAAFRKLGTNGTDTVTGGMLRVSGLGAGVSTSLLYDVNRDFPGAQPADFFSETLSLDFAYTAYGGALGFYARERPFDGPAVLALANFPAVNTVRLRLFYGADPITGAVGTSFADQTFSTPLNSGGDYRLRLEQTTTDAVPTFALSVLFSSTVRASLSGTLNPNLGNIYDLPGAVGLRVEGSANAPLFLLDNFGALPPPVPEPGSTALALLGLVCFGVVGRKSFAKMRE